MPLRSKRMPRQGVDHAPLRGGTTSAGSLFEEDSQEPALATRTVQREQPTETSITSHTPTTRSSSPPTPPGATGSPRRDAKTGK
jgi:hypothetical protein